MLPDLVAGDEAAQLDQILDALGLDPWQYSSEHHQLGPLHVRQGDALRVRLPICRLDDYRRSCVHLEVHAIPRELVLAEIAAQRALERQGGDAFLAGYSSDTQVGSSRCNVPEHDEL